MRRTQMFVKTRKDAPADEVSKNAKLLIRAGFVNKEMAGVYSYLPLGLRVLNNIAQIVREEMDAIGGQEIAMPTLQLKERYEASGRWDDKVVDDWFKTKLVNGTEMGLGFSHEENLSPLLKNFIQSYKDLPIAPYQITTKFRNELRSKSGLMRGREFIMKDMYSYAFDQAQHDEIYQQIQDAYGRIYKRLGIGDKTFLTFASGGSFAQFSHEFQTLSDAGEDTIYLDRAKKVAINKEVYTDEVIDLVGVKRSGLEEVKAIEVGNIFSLGTKFTKPFDLSVNDEAGRKIELIMGCYGIGISRVLGTIAELLSDDKGLVWPENIAPAKVYLANLGDIPHVISAADELYEQLTKAGVTVLYDDRQVSAGDKFADADLMGIPQRLVVSERTIKSGAHELKSRTHDSVKAVSTAEIIKILN